MITHHHKRKKMNKSVSNLNDISCSHINLCQYSWDSTELRKYMRVCLLELWLDSAIGLHCFIVLEAGSPTLGGQHGWFSLGLWWKTCPGLAPGSRRQGLRMSLSWESSCQACRKPWGGPSTQYCIKWEAWWCTPVILVHPWVGARGNQKFKVILEYLLSLRPSWVAWAPVLN